MQFTSLSCSLKDFGSDWRWDIGQPGRSSFPCSRLGRSTLFATFGACRGFGGSCDKEVRRDVNFWFFKVAGTCEVSCDSSLQLWLWRRAGTWRTSRCRLSGLLLSWNKKIFSNAHSIECDQQVLRNRFITRGSFADQIKIGKCTQRMLNKKKNYRLR